VEVRLLLELCSFDLKLLFEKGFEHDGSCSGIGGSPNAFDGLVQTAAAGDDRITERQPHVLRCKVDHERTPF
jgi:hypothetical protein